MRKTWSFIILFGFACFLQAQEYNITTFRAGDGLKTDMIKCIAEDSLGFIWVGTDDGLLRYDGTSFKHYPEAAATTYFKDFITTSDGKLLAIHDLGVTEIVNTGKEVRFVAFLNGSRNKTDTTLCYPKVAYEDAYGNLWFAEPQSVVRYFDGNWKRFEFGPEDNSTSFVRSFNFYSITDDQMLICSFSGNIYRYFHNGDSLVRLQGKTPAEEISAISQLGSQVLIGTNLGLFKLEITGNTFEMKQISDNVALVADIVRTAENQVFVSNELGKNEILTLEEDGGVSSRQLDVEGIRSKQGFLSREGLLWLSTKMGIILLEKKIFRKPNIGKAYLHIESILSTDDDSLVFILTKEAVTGLHKQTEKVVFSIDSPGGYFLSGTLVNGSLWASNIDKLMEIRDGRIIRSVDMSLYGRWIYDVKSDKNGHVWFMQEGTNGLRSFDPVAGKLDVFDEKRGLGRDVTNIVCETEGIYAAVDHPDEYLYFKATDSQEFVSIGHALPQQFQKGFTIVDMIIDNGRIWMGTSHGLFVHNESGIDKVKFNSDFDDLAIRSLFLDGEYLWFGNTLGLYRYSYQKGDYSIFNESSGLPVNIVVEEAILISGGKLWVGTPVGLAVTNYDERPFSITYTPRILDIKVNGNDFEVQNGLIKIPYQGFLELNYSSLSFPANQVFYSYRISGLSEEWSPPVTRSTLQLGDLDEGNYELEIKARKTGNFEWSEPLRTQIVVSVPYYKSPSFMLLMLLMLLVIIIVTRQVSTLVLKRRERSLQKLVTEKTFELNEYKDNLELLVHERTHELETAYQKLKETQEQLIQTEKMASLGILTAGVAHEINNPINYVQGGLYSIQSLLDDKMLRQDSAELQKLLTEVIGNMQFGVNRVTDITSSLSRFSRKGSNQYIPCDVHKVIESSLVILNHEIKDKCQLIKHFKAENCSVMADEGSIHQLFVNILSNSLQAMNEDGELVIETLNTRNKQQLEIRVIDNGTGIKEEIMSNIKDPFFTTKSPGTGTGLGLYISQMIVNNHAGELKISSEAGKGTEVCIIFNANTATETHA